MLFDEREFFSIINYSKVDRIEIKFDKIMKLKTNEEHEDSVIRNILKNTKFAQANLGGRKLQLSSYFLSKS